MVRCLLKHIVHVPWRPVGVGGSSRVGTQSANRVTNATVGPPPSLDRRLRRPVGRPLDHDESYALMSALFQRLRG